MTLGSNSKRLDRQPGASLLGDGRFRQYALYTVLWAGVFLIAFYPMLADGKSAICQSDGLPQHFPSLLFLRKWVRELFNNFFIERNFSVPMWDMTIGEGGNIFNCVSFRPMIWLSLLFPADRLELYYWVSIALSNYLTGIAFLLFIRRFERRGCFLVIGALMYAFCGYSMALCVRQSMFYDMLILLPPMLLGAEKLLKREAPLLFIATVFLAAIISFYELYIITLLTVIYALLRFFFQEDRGVRVFFPFLGRCACAYLIGLLLSCFSLLPKLQLVMGSIRAQEDLMGHVWLLGDLQYYRLLLQSVDRYVAGASDGYLMLTAAAMVVGLRVLLSRAPDDRVRQLRWAMLISILFLAVPFFSYAFTGFGGRNMRWSFVIAFITSAAVALRGDSLLDGDSLTGDFLFMGALALYCAVHIGLGLADETGSGHIEFLLLLLCAVLGRKWLCRAGRGELFGAVIAVLVVAEIGVYSFDIYADERGGLADTFLDAGTVTEQVRCFPTEALTMTEDDSVCRTDFLEVEWDNRYKSRNSGFRSDVPGVSGYFSYLPGSLVRTMAELGVSSKYMEFALSSYDQRTVLDELSSVKYFVGRPGDESYIPYGYEPVVETEDGIVYENSFALPLLYGYTGAISEAEYDALSMNEREQAMLQGAVAESELVEVLHPVFTDYVAIPQEEALAQLASEIGDSGRVDEEENSVTVDKRTTLHLTLPENTTGEVYLRFQGLMYESLTGDHAAGTLAASLGNTSKMFYSMGAEHQYYSGPSDQLVNLGYVEDFTGRITLVLRTEGRYSFEALDVVVQPMDAYAEQTDALRIDCGELSFAYNTFRADITLEEPRIVCLAVPCERGWTLKVNGEPTDILQVNHRYLGTELPAGQYCLEFHFAAPGLKAGLMISALTALGLGTAAVLRGVRRRQRKAAAAIPQQRSGTAP